MNVDEWIDGAQRTHRSVTIYQRADLIADLDELDRQIQIAERSGFTDEVTDLQTTWDTIATQFKNSGLTITVRGLHESEFKAIRAQANIDNVNETVLGARLLEAAIVEPVFTEAQLLRLEDKIGNAQIGRIVAAYVKASREQPPEPVMNEPAATP